MPNPENLRAPWKPGESGNPSGYSSGRRKRKFLKQWINERLNGQLDEDEAAIVDEKLRGLERGNALAADVVRQALDGDIEARRMIFGSEPRDLAVSGSVRLGSLDPLELFGQIRGLAARGNGAADHSGAAGGNGRDPAEGAS